MPQADGAQAPAQPSGLEGDALLARRRERMLPLVEAFDRWRAATLPGLLPSEPLSFTASTPRRTSPRWCASLAPKYWAATRARLVPDELAKELR